MEICFTVQYQAIPQNLQPLPITYLLTRVRQEMDTAADFTGSVFPCGLRYTARGQAVNSVVSFINALT